MVEDNKGAGVSFPPPLIFIVAMGIAIVCNRYFPQPIVPFTPILEYIALALFVIGGAIAISAVLALQLAKTSIEPWKPTSELLDKGIFGYSRNPIYLSFVLVGISVALYMNSLWVLLSLMPATFVLLVFVISKEEHYLSDKFGSQYINYCTRVRRWI
jgi:protein-S-isoprenylcysteine O-methyltransferase Ste14